MIHTKGLPMFGTLEASWTPPVDMPNLSTATMLSIDTETYDPDLLTRGPGALYGSGKIVGFSVAASGIAPIYVPISHTEGNVSNPAGWIMWLKDLLTNNIPVVGANLMYDAMWLSTLGVKIHGTMMDIQTAAALLDEERKSVHLDNLAIDYEIPVQKDPGNLLKRAVVDLLGKTDDPRKHLFKLHSKYVGPYAEADAAMPLLLWGKILPQLQAEDLLDVWKMECDLMPVLVKMMQRGIRVDMTKADELASDIDKQMDILKKRIRMRTGKDIDIWAVASVAAGAKRLGLHVPTTEKTGRESIKASFLDIQTHDYWKWIQELRELDKLCNTFVRQNVLALSTGGRVYPQYRPMKADEGGTRIGRLSASNPNIQQLPKDARVRSLMLPDDGQWLRCDWSQQEVRLLVHYAALCKLPKAEAARQMYIDCPQTDYHTMVAEMTGLSRKGGKGVTLGLMYSMGIDKMALSVGASRAETAAIREQYFKELPYARDLSAICQRKANQRGWIRNLITGRRRHFSLWEPTGTRAGDGIIALPYDKALERWPASSLERSRTYRAMQALISGSGADLMKRALIALDAAGIDTILTVHDEVGVNMHSNDDTKTVQAIMEGIAPEVSVPMKADPEVGPNWGCCTAIY